MKRSRRFLGEFPIRTTSPRKIYACSTCSDGSVLDPSIAIWYLRPSQALSGRLLASRPLSGMVPTSPDQKSASPAKRL